MPSPAEAGIETLPSARHRVRRTLGEWAEVVVTAVSAADTGNAVLPVAYWRRAAGIFGLALSMRLSPEIQIGISPRFDAILSSVNLSSLDFSVGLFAN
ncbi:MAG: hypothetical protein ACOYM2_13885 [Rectinemataceae bacterium]